MLGNRLQHNWVRLRCFLTGSGRKRTAYLIKKHYFSAVGENFVFFPRKVPQDPEYIRFHDNVVVATDVMFINHDIIHEALNHDGSGEKEIRKYYGCIEIFDNCFIGAESVILPNVKLGPNCIVAAGSVVTKSFGEGVVIGGNPARVIGSYEDVKQKRLAYTGEYEKFEGDRALHGELWRRFTGSD